MELGDRLGIAGLIVGLAGLGITILWPTKRWIGYVCLGLAFLLLVWWAVLETRTPRRTSPAAVVSAPVSPQPQPESKPVEAPKKPTKAAQDNSVHVDKGGKIDQQSSGDCSPNIVGGANNVNCGPPPVKLEYTFHVVADGEKPIFGFDRTKCPVISEIRIVPNQSVAPPIRVGLDFTSPGITQIATTVENVGATMGGGPFTIGMHAVSSPVSPGISPHHALLAGVCSDQPVGLTADPHLVD